jgi:gamma-glutamyltranspeptidase / glutathione hydrolase
MRATRKHLGWEAGRTIGAIIGVVALAINPAIGQLLDSRLAEPEIATVRIAKPATVSQRHMIVTANAYATAAGLEILRAGGSAVDAGIAAQWVLALVEPQSSGLGGGAFLVHWDAKTKAVDSIDGRETAPLAARPDRFLGADGNPRAFRDLVSQPAVVGVPGVVRAMALAHERHGKLPWASLFAPAITLADSGFVVSPRLSALLTAQGAGYFNNEARSLYFDEAGRAVNAGTVLRNTKLAAAFRAIADYGADAFYSGQIVDEIITQLATASAGGTDMTREDLASYRAKVRDPVCPRYRSFQICSMAAPSSGGITTGLALGLLEAARSRGQPELADPALKGSGDDTLRTHAADIALIIEAEKLAYADRDQFIADPDFSAQTADLLDPAYVAERAKLIDPSHPAPKVEPGTPPLKTGALGGSAHATSLAMFGADATVEQPGTSHMSVIDDDGNALGITTSVQTAFGSGIMASGFLLNSQLTDFSFRPVDAKGLPIANRVEGGKRPRSSMAPTIILNADGQPFAVLGSPGGSRIILYNLKAIVCLIDWDCDVERAASLANFGSRNGPLEVERGTAAHAELGPALSAAGHAISVVDMTSGLAIIVRRNGHLEGAADPRREGIAMGD